ncbi:hypothetical protein SDC9_131562 [bioreactor metagenome]|uniref:Uncharacterized protein n=1 Tax=bioreactor metagenome TaxID=1076179 RepID=A0A645D4S7_9ZZZZ
MAHHKARRALFDQHRTDATHAGAKAHIDQEQLGLRAVGGEHLAAVDDVVVAVLSRTGLQLGHGGTCVRLGHPQRDEFFSTQQIGQKTLLLLGRCVLHKRADRAEVARLHDVRALGAMQRHLLDRQHRVHQRAALAAVFFREGDAQQALLGQQLGGLPRIVRRMRTLQRAGCQLVLGKTRHAVCKFLMFLRESEIHEMTR